MKTLMKSETSTLIGGASQRRCDRIARRMRNADEDDNDRKFWRLSDRYGRLCE